ncbi:hypothetical protein CVT24_010400 [Panaeolus cyanescens]|uniref:Uncharacterized protein n=1 Tax=Panaeolus cyanescens TaxID=181874 RepID=A0A409WTZ4_9AGAR|nr:hypothetical protein CVT24_010400 [Panaeolus cyanescens]
MSQPSRGHAFLHAGQMFYSPNCDRHITPGPVKDDNVYRFHSTMDCSHEKFLEPQWWSPVYGWLSFVPTKPQWNKKNALFQCLNDIHAVRLENGWLGVGSKRLEQWTSFEDTMFLIATKLAKLTRTHGYLKPSPIASLQPNQSVYNAFCADEKVKRIRDWLFMWMGLASFYIAWANHRKLDWMCGLHAEGIDTTILDQISRSPVCDFTKECPRAGVILDYANISTCPPVEFFVENNVPVWYIWSEEQEVAHRQRKTPLHLLPSQIDIERARSQDLLQNVSPTFSMSPPQPSPKQDSSGNEVENQKSAVIMTKPWESYFEKRRAEIETMRSKYSAKHKQRVENHRRNPPRRRNTKVFVWDWSLDTDDWKLTRRKISLSEAEDWWDAPAHQTIYCADTNEWDFCEYFGLDSAALRKENELHAQMEDEMNNPRWHSNNTDAPAGPADAIATWSMEIEEHEDFNKQRNCFHSLGILAGNLRHTGAQLTPLAWTPENLLSCLYFRYGFIAPTNTTSDVTEAQVRDWKEALKCIRYPTDTPIRDAEGCHPEISSFLLALSKRITPHPMSFDLAPGSPYAISRSDFWERFEWKGSWILVKQQCFVGSETDSWRLALTNITDALFAFRVLAEHEQQKPLTRADVIEKLVQMCIPFRTLGERVSCSMKSLQAMIPRRDPNHQFTVEEFDNYCLMRDELVKSDRGRAALLAGGIAARLAQEHIGPYNAVRGPSKEVLFNGIGNCWHDNGTTYADDELLREEYSILCGEYETKTGTGNNAVYLSWWPPHHLWQRQSTGVHPGYWTESNEEWYQQRLRGIRAGTEKPKSSSNWMEWLRGWRKTSRFLKTMEDAATKLLVTD